MTKGIPSTSEKGRAEVGLPTTAFFFTLDQIASMINVQMETLRSKYLYYIGRSAGIMASHQMPAINIAPEGERADWRVLEQEFVKWCKRRGVRVSRYRI